MQDRYLKIEDCRNCVHVRWMGPNSDFRPMCNHGDVRDKMTEYPRALEFNVKQMSPPGWCPLDTMPSGAVSSTSVVGEILRTSRKIINDRDVSSVLCKVMEEVGELSSEVAIKAGKSYKQPGADGVEGEAIDAIIALVDLIYVAEKWVDEAALVKAVSKKLDKWHGKAMGIGTEMHGKQLEPLADAIRTLLPKGNRVVVHYGETSEVAHLASSYGLGVEDIQGIAKKVVEHILHRNDKKTTLVSCTLNGSRSRIRLINGSER